MEVKLKKTAKRSRVPRASQLSLARVLLVDDDPTARLTLQTVLQAGGYHVDAAASAAEAVGKMDRRAYELVLIDLHMESREAGLQVLAHARMMDYQPATAIITSSHQGNLKPVRRDRDLLIEPQDVPDLLTKVADLISERATRRVERELRQAGVS